MSGWGKRGPGVFALWYENSRRWKIFDLVGEIGNRPVDLLVLTWLSWYFIDNPGYRMCRVQRWAFWLWGNHSKCRQSFFFLWAHLPPIWKNPKNERLTVLYFAKCLLRDSWDFDHTQEFRVIAWFQLKLRPRLWPVGCLLNAALEIKNILSSSRLRDSNFSILRHPLACTLS